jgi:Helix-turn-helix domain
MMRKPTTLRTFAALDARARDNSASLEARGLWRIIDTFANNQGEKAFPSTATLSKLCGFKSHKTVFVYLKELESKGWLARNHIRGKSNSYIVIYPAKNGQKPMAKNDPTTYGKKRDTIP